MHMNDIEWREHQVHQEPNTSDPSQPIDNDDYGLTAAADLFSSNKHEEEVFEFEFYDSANDNTLPTLQLRGQAEYPHATGLALWGGGDILCEYLLSYASNYLAGKTVVELGSGLGLCSLVAHHLGAARVLCTDGDTNVLKTLRINVQHNSTSKLTQEKSYSKKRSAQNDASSQDRIACPQLIWGQHLDSFLETYGTSQVILAADCFYMRSSLNPFWNTVDQLLSSEGVLLFVNHCSSEVPLERALKTANDFGFTWTTEYTKESKVTPVYRMVRMKNLS